MRLMRKLLKDDVRFCSIVIGLIIAICTVLLSSGCTSAKNGRVISGTSTTIGMMVPLSADTNASFNLLEYLSGLYVGVNEDSVIEVEYSHMVKNSYFGCVSQEEEGYLKARIENYGKTNMLVKIEKSVTDDLERRVKERIDAQSKLMDAVIEAEQKGVSDKTVRSVIEIDAVKPEYGKR